MEKCNIEQKIDNIEILEFQIESDNLTTIRKVNPLSPIGGGNYLDNETIVGVKSPSEVVKNSIEDDALIEKYAIEISYVKEVYSVKKVTVLPCTPAFIIGMMNFRGKVISVIDIRNFLGFTAKIKSADDIKKVIVIKNDDIEIGIAVDDIIGCKDISIEEIQNNILGIINYNDNYFKGITKKRSIILNIKNIIMDKKMIVDEEVT